MMSFENNCAIGFEKTQMIFQSGLTKKSNGSFKSAAIGGEAQGVKRVGGPKESKKASAK